MDASFWIGFAAIFLTILGAAYTLGDRLSGIKAVLDILVDRQDKTDTALTGLNTQINDAVTEVAVHKEKISKNEEAINRLEKQAGLA